MANSFIPVIERLRVFWKAIDFKTVKSASFSFYLICWYIVYYFLLYAMNHNTGWVVIWMVFLGLIWFSVNRNIINAIHPPVEVILGLIFILYIVTYSYLNLNFNHLLSAGSSTGLESRLPGFFTFFLLGLLTLLFGLLLTLNNTAVITLQPANNNHSDTAKQTAIYYKQTVIFWYALIGMLGHQLVFFENLIYLYVFEFFLFLLLLNKTSWLERLSRYELYTSFVILLVLFLFMQDPASFQKVKMLEIQYKVTWFSFPLYLQSADQIIFSGFTGKNTHCGDL